MLYCRHLTANGAGTQYTVSSLKRCKERRFLFVVHWINCIIVVGEDMGGNSVIRKKVGMFFPTDYYATGMAEPI